jgi:hypothetical protein
MADEERHGRDTTREAEAEPLSVKGENGRAVTRAPVVRSALTSRKAR